MHSIDLSRKPIYVCEFASILTANMRLQSCENINIHMELSSAKVEKATFNEIMYIKWKTVYAKTNGATYIVVIEISALLIAHLRLENGEKTAGLANAPLGTSHGVTLPGFRVTSWPNAVSYVI